MVKSHNVKISFKNTTSYPMTYHSVWFDSGRVGDRFAWPKCIMKMHTDSVLCYEKDWSLAGCSGYVQYLMNGSIVTIAFSNPSAGNNKLGVGAGIEGAMLWENISSHDYQDFTESIEVGNVPIIVHCRCSGGETNDCEVLFHEPNFTPRPTYDPRLVQRPVLPPPYTVNVFPPK